MEKKLAKFFKVQKMFGLTVIWILDKEAVEREHSFSCQDWFSCSSDFMLFLYVIYYEDLKSSGLYFSYTYIDI